MIGARRRLDEIRARGQDSCRPLWVEFQPPPTVLSELAGDQTPLGRLQVVAAHVASVDWRAGRLGLVNCGDFPPALAAIREELAGALAGAEAAVMADAAAGETSLASDELQRRSRSLRDEGAGRPVFVLRQWLTNIQAWREVLGV